MVPKVVAKLLCSLMTRAGSGSPFSSDEPVPQFQSPECASCFTAAAARDLPDIFATPELLLTLMQYEIPES